MWLRGSDEHATPFILTSSSGLPQEYYTQSKNRLFSVFMGAQRGMKNLVAELGAMGVPKSAKIGNEEMADQVRWIRSYVVEELDGKLGTICIYQASDPDSIREHARRVGMPGDDILPIVKTVVVRTDPDNG